MKGKKITLKRPLITFDLESTGVNTRTAKIVEISLVIKYPGKKKDLIKTRKINPLIHIPEETSLIHGIYDKDVKDEPSFDQIADGLADLIRGSDICGYNSNRFDVPLLLAEFERVGIVDVFDDCQLIDVFNLYCHFNPRTLIAAYSEYCGKDLDAHKAEEDAKATIEVLEAILNEHNHEIEDQSVEGLASLSKRSRAIDILGIIVKSDRGPVFSIGKYKGEPVLDHRDYCDWIINVSDFSENTKRVLDKILKTGS